MSPEQAPSRALVIGGGFGGIAAALRLRARGYAVHLVDRCDQLGGRARVFERDGFRHDAGPTVLTAPSLFRELFAMHGRCLDDVVELVTPTPWYRFRFADGDHFDYGPDEAATEAEIARIHPPDLAGYRELRRWCDAIHAVGYEQLADQPFHSFRRMLGQAPSLLKLRSHESVWQMVCRFLEHDKLRRAFSITPLLVGGNPFATTSIYGLINGLERAEGIWFAMGGTGALIQALAELMHEVGITVELEAHVERLIIENGAARGAVLASGEQRRADLVVSNMDPARLYALPDMPRAMFPAIRRRWGELSMGLYVLYFGTRRQYPDVAHHTVWFGERYRELLADIFKRKHLAEDFSLYLHRPTATDPSFAPAGCDSFYVLCPVPNLRGGQDWATEGPRLRDRIVAALEATLLPGLADTITAEFAMTPEDFRRDYDAEAGAGFSLSPRFTQSAWFRYHNRGEGLADLYVVGAGPHPGAGVPGVLNSARTLERLLPARP